MPRRGASPLALASQPIKTRTRNQILLVDKKTTIPLIITKNMKTTFTDDELYDMTLDIAPVLYVHGTDVFKTCVSTFDVDGDSVHYITETLFRLCKKELTKLVTIATRSLHKIKEELGEETKLNEAEESKLNEAEKSMQTD